MAIKIINPGKDKFIMHCKRCGCDFSYELEDLMLKVDLESGVYSVVECPHCEVEIKVNNQ